MYTSSQRQQDLLAILIASANKMAEIERARELYESCHGKFNGEIEVIFFRRPAENKCPLEIKEDGNWTEVISFNFGDAAITKDYYARRLYVELAMIP